jgi:Flp pilus assembly protein CpaB
VKRSNRLIILLGAFFAVVAFIGVILLASGGGVSSGTPTPTPQPKVNVVYAKADINLGEKITEEMVETKQMTVSERAALGNDTFTSVNEVIGRVAGGKIPKGQPLHGSYDFLNPGQIAKGKSISSAIGEGMVGVSMEVDQVNGVGTLIVPGDRVDIILAVWVTSADLTGTRRGATMKASGGEDVTAKMVIQNVKVIATLLPAAEPETGTATKTAAPVASADTITQNEQHMMVIIEVKPDQAEVIRWAQRSEKVDPQNYISLGLALRSDKDNDKPTRSTPGITFKKLVEMYGVLPVDPRAYIPQDILTTFSW